MTADQLARLTGLLADAAQAAATIELRALTGHDDEPTITLAADLKTRCAACLDLVNKLTQTEERK